MMLVMLMIAPQVQAEKTNKQVPGYVIDGLKDYKTKGYEAAVRTWLKDSPYEKGTEMATRIQYFKNIELLYGKFIDYKIIAIQETGSSHMVYVQMHYERQSVYLQITSFLKNEKWVFSLYKIDQNQRIPGNLGSK
jgi:hypothetical protein